MKRREFLKSAAVAGVTATWANPSTSAAAPQNQPEPPLKDYPVGPDSIRKPDVPAGKVFSFSMDKSRFFPGTQRTIDVYVPAQYTADRPACVLVALDHLMRTQPIVFDNLIHRKELPVIIAIGLSSGTDASAEPPHNPRFNRSFEFDSLSAVLADFILQELLPAVEQHQTPDGLPIHLSTDPNDRGMMGGSTGGIGSFTVAWQRPDAFRRVYSMIGTYVGMRGGDRYPVLVRKQTQNRCAFFCRMAAAMAGPEAWNSATGGWAIRKWSARSRSPGIKSTMPGEYLGTKAATANRFFPT